ncbi:MAG: (2Fe-2S)-binding protein [Desulfobacter sp.]|nr:MAG: (2Fe-2S)-binding protein [Desulfobacter sp.]
MPHLSINSQTVEFQPGQTILDLCEALSINIPTLCHLAGTTPTGTCGVCLVEEAKAGMVKACSTPAEAGLEIRTHGVAVREARKKAIEALVATGNHNCGVAGAMTESFTDFQMDAGDMEASYDLCPVWGDCRLQDLVYEYQARTGLFDSGWKKEVPDVANPMIVRDFSRCIGCGRCVKACNEVQVNLAIDMDRSNGRDVVATKEGNGLVESNCVFCGECIQACPVGALVEKKAQNQWRPWEIEKIRTTCPYCGVGCQQWLHVKDEKIVKVTGVEEGAPNKGRLCVKGRFGYDFIYSDERIKRPVIRENGEFKEVSWDHALDYTADRLKAIIDESGPDALAGVSCARSINEDSYQMQKLFRAVFKTNNIDHCART